MKRFLARVTGKSNYQFVIKDRVNLSDLKACSEVLDSSWFTHKTSPVEVGFPDKKSILVIAPHPDDDTFGAGATLMKAIAHGARVHVMYITDGSNDPERASLIRYDASEVCGAVGATSTFMGLRTGNIPFADPEVSRRIVSVINEHNPEAIFIPFLLDDHDDHRRANQLLLAIGGELPRGLVEVWAYQVYSTVAPNLVVDITEMVERKREIIKLWRNVSGNRDWAHYILGMNAANCRYLPSDRPLYAETFFVCQYEEYLELCESYFSHPPQEIYYSPTYRMSL